jgi:hypothetical protein
MKRRYVAIVRQMPHRTNKKVNPIRAAMRQMAHLHLAAPMPRGRSNCDQAFGRPCRRGRAPPLIATERFADRPARAPPSPLPARARASPRADPPPARTPNSLARPHAPTAFRIHPPSPRQKPVRAAPTQTPPRRSTAFPRAKRPALARARARRPAAPPRRARPEPSYGIVTGRAQWLYRRAFWCAHYVRMI